MCKKSVPCNCHGQNSRPSCISVSIDINNNFDCICEPCSSNSRVQTSDVVAGLLKYNSNLTKYLSAYQSTAPVKIEPIDAGQGVHKTDKSIVDLYNLKFLSPDSYPPPKPAPKPQPLLQPVSIETQTSPRNKEQTKQADMIKPEKERKPVLTGDAAKLQKHFKQMAASSRYLSNTGFKKYFGRECFENYGRQNTTGVADGIVYNNYLKTFNISPHCGGNIPLTEETHKHALMAGDNRHYEPPKNLQTHYGNKNDVAQIEGDLNKPISNMAEVIEKSQRHHQQQERYSRSPNLNIISHCPDIIKTKPPPKRQVLIQSLDRPKYYPDFKPSTSKTKQHHQGAQPPHTSKQSPSALKNQTDIKIGQTEREKLRQEDVQQLRVRERGRAEMAEEGARNQVSGQVGREAEFWEENLLDPRMKLKREIIEQCYRSRMVGSEIEHSWKPACLACRERRFTKCCCRK